MMGKYATFGIIKSKYSSFMVHVRVRTKCDALQTQKWTWYHITMHTRLSRHVYLHTDFNGIRKCAWYALSEDDEFSQPEKHLPDMHRPPFPTTSTKKNWPGAGPAMSQWNTMNSARQRSCYLFCVLLLNKVSTRLFLISDDFQTLRLPQTFYFVFTQCSARLLFLLLCLVSD